MWGWLHVCGLARPGFGGGGQSLQLAAVGKGTCRYKRERDDCVTPASQPTPTPRVIACV